ncbi:transposase [Ferruginivarius sediminum]|uniref:Transposase n=1 Tax=Ferruginivarius sediminum TaxID=2661937 RepID=A0A369TCE3_9PROT|nr:transposase [Ferruginivarius sediminum]
MRARLRELAGQRKRYGYLHLHVLLRREDLVVNAKRTCRLYKEEGLAVRTKKRRRLPGRERVLLAAPERRNAGTSGGPWISSATACAPAAACVSSTSSTTTAGRVLGSSSMCRSPATVWRASSTSWPTSTACPRRSSWTTARLEPLWGARAPRVPTEEFDDILGKDTDLAPNPGLGIRPDSSSWSAYIEIARGPVIRCPLPERQRLARGSQWLPLRRLAITCPKSM